MLRPARLISLTICLQLAAPLAGSAGALAQAPAAAVSTGSASTAAKSSPAEVVDRFHQALLEVMKNADELGFQGRYDFLRPVIGQTFDLGFMSSKCVGSYWKKLSPEDQKRWIEKFSGFLTANYAGNFSAYDGESFELLGEEEATRATRIVLTRLLVPSAENVLLNYRLIETRTGWRIIDIYLKGTVSELALRRSDFSSTLKRDGFEELAAAVDRKIEDLREKSGG